MDKIKFTGERLHTLLKLERGMVTGLESLKEDSIYEQTLKVKKKFQIYKKLSLDNFTLRSCVIF